MIVIQGRWWRYLHIANKTCFRSTNDEFIFRPYQPGDEGQIVRLLELVFNGWPHYDISCTPLQHWRWKCQSGPIKSYCAVCVYEDQIVACLHAIPRRVKIGNRFVLGSYGVDFAVHPHFRGRGLSTRTNAATDKLLIKAGVKFTYALIGNPILIKKYLREYTRFPHNLTNLVRINDINAQLRAMPINNAWLMKIGFHAATLINSVSNKMSGSVSRDHDLNISQIKTFDERIDVFWSIISEHYKFIGERNRDYLNWRYCDPRAGEYIVKIIEGDDRTILGYSVLRINRYLDNYPVGYIVDLMTLPDSTKVLHALAADATSYFDENGVNIINYLVTHGHPYERLLKKHGFLDSRIKIQFFLESYGDADIIGDIDQRPSKEIFFSWGDHDTLPLGF